ncbi:DMT family transporter [Nesterenkonia halotolerans]|uniref:Drug/metabolite transporter (DMT)-like permease n=1 Tax=Nesterenkonia halotolerans TaxID=225325 RepID=A0ABR9J980_9MICC|nr:DMT family transporter [Nesterenkonia halotolerans]MBE1515554.1 drug/metabolite transporter (DMT)-like permease [Nesterenkonia halotolerans]
MTEKSQDESIETLPVSETSAEEAEAPHASAADGDAETGTAETPTDQQTPDDEAPARDENPTDGPAAEDKNALEEDPAAKDTTESDTDTSDADTTVSDQDREPEPEVGHQDDDAPAPSVVRSSHPTPARPMTAETGHEQSGISGFFDNLDEKFFAAARRVGDAFRRPDATAETENASPATATEATKEPGNTSEPDQIPVEGPLEDPERRFAEDPSSLPSPSAEEDDAVQGPLTETQTEQEPAPVTLPKPRRALDERRQRDVILEKAAAIEAATARNYRPTGREFVEFADDEEDLFTYIPPYNLPSRDPDPAPVRTDLYRQVFVSIGALAALVSLGWMFGMFTSAPAILGGNGLDELAEGWYSGNRALLSPEANFYWLWPFIVIGLLAHAVYQWTTTQTATPRQRRSGWQVGSASVLMLIWTASIHTGMLTLAVLAALAAALALIDAIRQFTFRTARNSLERRLADTTTGLFAGWALVAAMSSLSIWLTAMGWHIPGFPAVIWALIGLGICIWAASYYAMTERGRITLALGMGWGMFWLIFPRILSDVTSVWVALCAAMGAFVVILATESRRHKINHAERRAAMGRPLEDII